MLTIKNKYILFSTIIFMSLSIIACGKTVTENGITPPSELETINAVRLIIGDLDPQPLLLKGGDCLYQANVISDTVQQATLRLNELTCNGESIELSDKLPEITLLNLEVLRSAAVVGVVNEIQVGTKVDGSNWTDLIHRN